MQKKKYRLKNTDEVENKPPPNKSSFSFQFIKIFVSQFPLEKLTKIELPNRKVRSQHIERASAETKADWRAEEGQADILKRQLSMNSMNGGWTQSRIDQSRQSNTQVEGQIKFLLNLLAPDNYAITLSRIKPLILQPQMMEVFVRSLLGKVKFESKYHSLYATLCHQLGSDKRLNSLARLLDSRLTESVRNISAEDYSSVRSRKDFTMTAVFMGQLFLQQVINRQAINHITSHYLTQYHNKPLENHRYLETLIHIYSHIGQYELQHPEQLKPSADLSQLTPDVLSFITFEDVFRMFKQLQATLQTGRIWSLVANVLEKRQKKWEKTIVPQETLHRALSLPVNLVDSSSEIFPQDMSQTLTKAIKNVDVKQLRQLYLKDPLSFLEVFIVHFFRMKMVDILTLVNMVWGLVDEGILQVDLLWDSFKLKFQPIVMDQPDYPYTKKALCQLFLPYVKNDYFQIDSLMQFVASEEEEEFVSSLSEMMEVEVQSQRQN